MKTVSEIDGESLERCRAYLKLLAGTQLDSFLGQHVDASDLVQQTLLDAVAKAKQFRGRSEAELISWLCQILANNLIDVIRYHRRAKRDIALIQSLDGSIAQSCRRLDALAQSYSTPSQRAEMNEELLRLPEALESLSRPQREAIVLHHLKGLKLTETAQSMGKSESAVCGLLHRGMKRLHEILGE